MRYFKVKRYVFNGLESYHVIDTTTNITESNHPTLELALSAMRQLNSCERVKAKVRISLGGTV